GSFRVSDSGTITCSRLYLVLVVMIAVALGGAHGTAVVGVANFDGAVHIGQADMGAAAAERPMHVMANHVMAGMQAEISGDSPVDGARFEAGLRVRRQGQFDVAIDGFKVQALGGHT